MLLPNIDKASIDLKKLSNYALNVSHPEGRHKARVFFSALGITASDAEWLANSILAKLSQSNAELQSDTSWGSIYRIEMEIVRGAKCAKVRTGWLCAENTARLLTCFVVGGRNETT